MRNVSLLLLSLPLLFSCRSDNAILDLDEEDTGEIGDDEPIEPVDPYENATLEIVSPAPNSFLAYGEESEFEAVLWSQAGEPLVFDEINWNSTIDEGWRHEGGAFQDGSLDVGTHLLRVNATLPNGERVFGAVGGILVQSEFAGTYAGTTLVNTDFGDFAVGCAGGAIMVIDVYGENAEGESDCILSFDGEVIELDYVYDLDMKGEELTGEAAVSLYGFELPTDFLGGIDEDGLLVGNWEQDVFGFMEIDGELSLSRVSRDTSFYE